VAQQLVPFYTVPSWVPIAAPPDHDPSEWVDLRELAMPFRQLDWPSPERRDPHLSHSQIFTRNAALYDPTALVPGAAGPQPPATRYGLVFQGTLAIERANGEFCCLQLARAFQGAKVLPLELLEALPPPIEAIFLRIDRCEASGLPLPRCETRPWPVEGSMDSLPPSPHFSHTPAQELANDHNSQRQSGSGKLLFRLLWSNVMFCRELLHCNLKSVFR